MVFVGGPRQVGKTTLAFQLLGNADPEQSAYFNWDIHGTKTRILNHELPVDQKLLVFDEIHKYRQWRNFLKGLFDQYKSKKEILVTGSARLDVFRRGGDALTGRYHYYRFHPLSLCEISQQPKSSDLDHLLKFGGFPEPFLKGEERAWKVWQNERVTRVVQEDLISLERVNELSQLSLLAEILPIRVGSLLSLNNLRTELKVSYEAVARWIEIFDNLYYSFRISPFGFAPLRTAKKEKKLYLWDWSSVPNESARVENFVASHLLKYCHARYDHFGERLELLFLRSPIGKEIDFLVCDRKKPVFAVECKSGDREVSSSIKYFAPRMPIPRFFQVHLGKKHVEVKDYRTEIIPMTQFGKWLGV
ncbi:MAG: ATP-binding protein [Deltaproteobacteria bacterium]|nr:ATP-binding protein [Deltaproteobacteria bacterium]MBI3294193.1 ATP-binding protein [Deltaproteobacteria bacterium]